MYSYDKVSKNYLFVNFILLFLYFLFVFKRTVESKWKYVKRNW